MIPRTMSERRCSVFAVTAALVLFVAITAHLPTGVRSSAIRPVSGSSSSVVRHKRDTLLIVPTDAVQVAEDAAQDGVIREKRTLHKLKPLVVLPAKLALGAGAKLVAGAKLGAKAVGLGAKALGVGAVGLKAVKKVAKVTVKAATALGIKAVLLNFLFQKINQVIDFKTRLLSNLDQRNKNQNAQFLSPLGPSSGKSSSGSVGNKDYDSYVPPPPPPPPPAPAGFVDSPDSQGFVTNSAFVAVNPGSDLIASPPPPPPSGFSADDPQAFGGPTQAIVSAQQDVGGTFQSAFAATNDDGSPSSETSF